MNTWKSVDKSEWPRGEWDNEPDKAHWIHAGLDCLIVRNRLGALCGYVGIPESHPLYGKDYDDVGVDVHGGLTFAVSCHEPTPDEYAKLFLAIPQERLNNALIYPNGDEARRIRKIESNRLKTFEQWFDSEMSRRICHRVAPGRPDKVWWLGFDCGHFMDIIPGMSRVLPDEPGTYKNFKYAESEVRSLADQLAEVV